jgi:hypothetical protein
LASARRELEVLVWRFARNALHLGLGCGADRTRRTRSRRRCSSTALAIFRHSVGATYAFLRFVQAGRRRNAALNIAFAATRTATVWRLFMRNILLSSVAAAALSLSGAFAIAQERSPGGAPAEKPGASTPGATNATRSPSAAATGEHGKQGAAEHASPERGAAAEHKSTEHGAAAESRHQGQASESKTGESRSHGQQTGESNPRASESKTGTAGSNEKTNAASETKAPGAAHTNAATETKGPGTSSNAASETKSSSGTKANAASETKGSGTGTSNAATTKPSTAAAPNQANEPGKAATAREPASSTNSAATTGNGRQKPGAAPTGSAGLNQAGSGNEGRSNVNTNVNIEPQQQSRIVETLRSRHSDAVVNNVNFSVSVGAVVPEHVHYRPLPDEIVSIVPQYRGYDYVIVHDEVVIVEPKTRKIVTVLHEGGGGGTSARRARLSIPTEKRSKIRSEIISSYHGPRDARFDVRVGERLPESVTLQRLPPEVYALDPDLRTYEYVVVGEEVVFVEPQTREIVEVLD